MSAARTAGLGLARYRGSLRACGRAYGDEHAERIHHFTQAMVQPTPGRLRYAEACWRRIKPWHPALAELIAAIAAGARCPLAELVLLLLHEERIHQRHCTAAGATGAATVDGGAIIGQTWDWPTLLYPWGSVVRMSSDAMPATITYALPGLWSCAGINEHGLSLVWTTAGTAEKTAPARVGIPTYVLIAAVLGCRDCDEAVALIQRAHHAGAFIMMLSDARGALWVVEAIPAAVEAVRATEVAARANHFLSRDLARAVHQDLRRCRRGDRSPARCARMQGLLDRGRGRIDARAIEAALRDQGGGFPICREGHGVAVMTIAAFHCQPRERTFTHCLGPPSRGSFVRTGFADAEPDAQADRHAARAAGPARTGRAGGRP